MSVAPYTPSGEVDDTSPDTDRSVAMSELRKDDPNEEGQQKEKDNNDGDDDDDDNPKPLSKRDNSDLLNLTLHQVARSGDANIAKILLSYMHGNKVKKINMKDKDCVTPLHYAARNEHLEVMKVLIEHGAEVNVVDDELMTPLHYAARYKRERNKKDSVGDSDSLLTKLGSILYQPSTYNRSLNLRDTDKMGEVDPGIVYLVEKGAVLNQEDKYGLTPLHYAAMRGNELALRQLLTYSDINIEAEDKQGMRALHMAATHNHEEEVGILIQANADLRCKDNEDITPLHCAAYEGNIGVVKLLFEEASKRSGNVMISEMMSDKDCDKNTCLHHAVQNGSVEIVKLCLEYKADVNTPSINNMYPLHQAAKVGDLDCVKLLVKHKARIDCVNEDMATPLHLAAANNHEDIVKYLVKKRASLDKKDKDCYTPLLMAAYTGHGSIVHFLIDKGANAAALDKDDKTAVYLAAEEDKGEALKEMLAHPQVLKLIEYGDRYDNHPLHVAAQEGFLDVVTILLEHGAMIECKNEEEQTPLHLAAKYGRTRVVKELVQKKKTSVNDEDENSDTPLHLAADNGHKKVVNVLLQYGADVAARNSLLWTPLDCAAEKGRLKIVRILLDADAPIDATDKTNTTPLLLAAKNGHENVVTYLLEHQANISQRDSDGNNCLDLAIDSNKPEVALAILNSKNWEDAMRNETRDPYTEIRSTPMRKLIKKMPEVAEQVFLKCMVANQVNPEHENYKVTFNYEFLDDTYSDWGEKGSSEQGSSIGSTYNEDFTLSAGVTPYTKDSAVLKKNHPLMIMVTSKRENLLGHPLVSALLRHKWNSFGRLFYYINFVIYAVFLIFLSGYVLTTKPPHTYYSVLGLSIKNVTETEACRAADASSLLKQDLFATIGKYIIMILSGWNLIKEIMQMYHAKLNYIGFENLIEWLTYISAVLLVIDFSSCQRDSGYRFDPFATPWESLIKTTVMMIGEYDYADVFYSDSDVLTDHHPAMTFIMFIMFMILMSIIIMNLLVGLAVDDIKAVQEKAALRRMAMQVDLALDVEKVVPDFLRRRYIVKCEKIFPNRGFLNTFRRFKVTDTGDLSSETIAKALDPDLDEIKTVIGKQEKMEKELSQVKTRVKEVQMQTFRVEGMLTALLQSQQIEFDAEDFQENLEH